MVGIKRPSPGPTTDEQRGRARGALWGLAVGDALGTTLEFKTLTAPSFPELCPGPHRDITGKGPFDVRPGQVTDDTQMAVALATSLRGLRLFDAGDVLGRYRAWRPHAFDIGAQTAAVLDAYKPAAGPFHAALAYWVHKGRQPAGNGSLMRTAPLGVFFWKDREARVKASLEDSALTHVDPRCQLACVALNAAIAQAIAAPGTPDPKKIIGLVAGELTVAAARLGRQLPDHVREVQEAVTALKADLDLAQKPDPLLYGPEIHLHHHQGFVRVAFRLAFWELLHAPSFEAALVDVVNRGGDADTNGAITGALLGAFHSEAGIPSCWRAAVQEAVPRQPALREAYHPVQLLPLVELALTPRDR
jgi:ADP-ribosyl-[dinitrogen reductase] hydrolase